MVQSVGIDLNVYFKLKFLCLRLNYLCTHNVKLLVIPHKEYCHIKGIYPRTLNLLQQKKVLHDQTDLISSKEFNKVGLENQIRLYKSPLSLNLQINFTILKSYLPQIK